MTDVFRCDYCGQLTNLSSAVIGWRLVEAGDDRRVWLPTVHCGTYCGRVASSPIGSGRG